MSEHVLPEWATEENLAIARQMRGGGDDHSYADIAEHFGLPRDQWKLVKDALDAAPTPSAAAPSAAAAGNDEVGARPLSKLEALAAKVEAQRAEHGAQSDGLTAEIARARGDTPLSEAEYALVERIFVADTGESFKDIAAAMDPPRHWLTVANALGRRGWYRPDFQMLPYCTGTPEGQRRLAAERTAGKVNAAVYASELIANADEVLADVT